VEDELAVVLGEAAEKLAEALEETRGVAGVAPVAVIVGGVLGDGPKFGGRIAVVKELVERNFEGAGQFFKGLDARDGVAVFDARDVATLEAGALLDVALGKVFLLADSF